MGHLKLAPESVTAEVSEVSQDKKTIKAPVWEKPKLEDVSEQVMAQPYIRFT